MGINFYLYYNFIAFDMFSSALEFLLYAYAKSIISILMQKPYVLVCKNCDLHFTLIPCTQQFNIDVKDKFINKAEDTCTRHSKMECGTFVQCMLFCFRCHILYIFQGRHMHVLHGLDVNKVPNYKMKVLRCFRICIRSLNIIIFFLILRIK